MTLRSAEPDPWKHTDFGGFSDWCTAQAMPDQRAARLNVTGAERW